MDHGRLRICQTIQVPAEHNHFGMVAWEISAQDLLYTRCRGHITAQFPQDAFTFFTVLCGDRVCVKFPFLGADFFPYQNIAEYIMRHRKNPVFHGLLDGIIIGDTVTK